MDDAEMNTSTPSTVHSPETGSPILKSANFQLSSALPISFRHLDLCITLPSSPVVSSIASPATTTEGSSVSSNNSNYGDLDCTDVGVGFSEEATRALISLVQSYVVTGEKKDWERIQYLLAEEGYRYTTSKCQQRWYNVFKEYKEVVQHNERTETEVIQRRAADKSMVGRKRNWRYFDQMDCFMRGNIAQPSPTAKTPSMSFTGRSSDVFRSSQPSSPSSSSLLFSNAEDRGLKEGEPGSSAPFLPSEDLFDDAGSFQDFTDDPPPNNTALLPHNPQHVSLLISDAQTPAPASSKVSIERVKTRKKRKKEEATLTTLPPEPPLLSTVKASAARFSLISGLSHGEKDIFPPLPSGASDILLQEEVLQLKSEIRDLREEIRRRDEEMLFELSKNHNELCSLLGSSLRWNKKCT